MKKIIFFLTVVLLSSCFNSEIKSFKKSARDTSITSIIYARDWQKNEILPVVATKISFDTVLNGVETRDSIYIVAETLTLVDSLTRAPIIDSLGQVRRVYKWSAPIDKSFILMDFNKKYVLTQKK